MNNNPILEAALEYAGRGWSVMPVGRNKKPLIKWREATREELTNADNIRRLWAQFPDANVGIITGARSGGLVVIDEDIDDDKGLDGVKALEDWCDQNDICPIDSPATVQTGRGGRHLYVRSEFVYHNQQGCLEGVDIRGEGGYVVAPPSIHGETGREYIWDIETDFPEVPEADSDVTFFLASMENQGKKETKTGVMKNDFTQKVSEGGRNTKLFKYIARLQYDGEKDSDIVDYAKAYNETHLQPPLDDEEVISVINSVLGRYEKGEQFQNNPPENGRMPWEIPEGKDGKINLEYFHHWKRTKDGDTYPTGVYDIRILDYLKRNGEIRVLGSLPYIYEHGVFIQDENGVKLKTMIKGLIYPEFVKSYTIKRIYDLFICDAEIHVKTENLNDYPKEWINFLNGFYDPVNRRLIPHDMKYLAVNQIPHVFNPDVIPEGETVDSWLDFITPDPDDREMLLQYCGYCMTTDTRQQKFLILYGTGGSGKSTLINLLENVVGEDNISHVSLKKLNERFQSTPLLFKLVNSCADLEVDAIKDPSMVKQLLGEDGIQIEPKGEKHFKFKLYAKQIFSTNDMPTVLNDRSNGFYRKLMILSMNRTPQTVDHDFFNKLKAETPRFIWLCVNALSEMYKTGSITESESSIAAVKQTRADSDTIQAFIDECCEVGEGFKVQRRDLYDIFCDFCTQEDRTKFKNKEFFKGMRVKGFKENTVNGYPYFYGLRPDQDAMFKMYTGLSAYQRKLCPFNQEPLKSKLNEYGVDLDKKG